MGARVVAIIPARYESTRLPGKPLADLDGQPMIQRVYQRTAQAHGVERVLVATDDAATVVSLESDDPTGSAPEVRLAQMPQRRAELRGYFARGEPGLRRHGRASTILTSNRPVEDWGKLLGDTPAVTAMLDRLLEHGHVITCGPKSWRVKTHIGGEVAAVGRSITVSAPWRGAQRRVSTSSSVLLLTGEAPMLALILVVIMPMPTGSSRLGACSPRQWPASSRSWPRCAMVWFTR